MGNPPTKCSVHKGHNAVNRYFIASHQPDLITYNDRMEVSLTGDVTFPGSLIFIYGEHFTKNSSAAT
jgi:hypothetical protein